VRALAARLAALSLSIVACAGAPARPPPLPPPAAAAPSPSVELPDGCAAGRTIALEGHTASVVVARCRDAITARSDVDNELQMPPAEDCLFLAGAQGKPLRTSCGAGAGVFDVAGERLVKLRRGGPPTLLVGTIHANDVGVQASVRFEAYALVDEAWRAVPSPTWPTRGADLLGDGQLIFPVTVARLDLGYCLPRMACGAYFADANAIVYVNGFETWNGAAYASDLRALRPVYERALARVRDEVRRSPQVPPQPKNDEVIPFEEGKTQDWYGDCFLGRVRQAGEIFAYRRVLGDDAPAAIAEADAVMKDFQLGACREFFRLGEEPSWAKLRAQLLSAKVPTLAR
jgi:hypothetical protein